MTPPLASRRLLPGLMATLLLSLATHAHALINPKFTPVELVSHADAICHLTLTAVAGDDVSLTLTKTVRGDAPKALKLTLSDEARKDFTKSLNKQKATPATLFTGDFSSANMQDETKPDQAVGALHVGGTWFLLTQTDNAWRIDADPLNLKAIWAGSDEMLRRVVDYIQADGARADVPVKAGIEWGNVTTLGKVPGTVSDVRAAKLDPKEPPLIHVLSDAGDRLYQRAADGKYTDVTDKLKLAAKSKLALWADFAGEGTPALLSWDGQALTLNTYANGTFQATPVKTALSNCLSLAAIDVGQSRPGIIVGTTGGPVLLTPGAAAGAWTPQPLLPAGDRPAAGRCLVADFDADGLPDIAQITPTGVQLYKATALGKFAPPVDACKIALTDIASARTADFDADGALDIVLATRTRVVMLHNDGHGAFTDIFPESGEPEYVSKPEPAAVLPCDFNSDGRQDFAVLYRNIGPQLFYSRGFATYGHALNLDLGGSGPAALGPVGAGQQAALIADLDGDGAQDFVFVAADGQVQLVSREAKPATPLLHLTVPLPPKVAGPIRVVATDGKRCLGAQNITAESPAFFAKQLKGMLTLTWRLPGDTADQKQMLMITAPKLFEVPSKK